VAPLYGSVLTYGAVDEAVAPGQLKIDELKHMLELLS
ncbi:MAG: type I 3-dehydroquinate dehydratase, partial [Methanosarcinales archaeon]|nr:type I 3-dehydroquinate dehydratase [Methanosarcinales archaeon]